MPVTPQMLELATTFRAQLLARERAAASAMVRYYGTIWGQLQQGIVDLQREVAQMQAAGEPVSVSMIRRLDRMDALQRQVTGEMARFAEYADGAISGAQREAIAAAERDAPRLVQASFLRDSGIEVQFGRMPADAVEAMIGTLQDGSPLRDLLAQAVGDAAQEFADALVNGLATGLNPRVVAQQLRSTFGMGLTRALRIARTEQLRAYRTASLHSYQNSGGIVKGWERHCALDDRVCLACLVLDGKLYGLDEEIDDHVQGRCLPAGTLASGPLPVAASVRYYAGQLVRIRTASGAELSLTPNHPVLTLRGWVAADRLHEGDDVIRTFGGKNAATPVNEHDYQVPALIEQIAEALPVVFREVPSTAEDFHGDGIDGEVYIVRANSLLWDGYDATLQKPGSKQLFSGGLMGNALLSSLGDIAAMLESLLGAAHGFLGDLDTAMMFFTRSLLGQQAIGLSLVSAGHPCFSEANGNDIARNAVGSSQGVLGLASSIAGGYLFSGERKRLQPSVRDLTALDRLSFSHRAKQAMSLEGIREALLADVESSGGVLSAVAGEVGPDCILEVGRVGFQGHVYNLHTETGWYIANSIPHSTEDASGILVHNCVMLPITKTYAELGIDAPEPDFSREMGQDWFLRQDEATQRKMMGNGMYDAWRDGQFQLSDIPKLRTDPTWGNSWVPKSLQELTGAQ